MRGNWEMRRLDSVCTFINGKAYNKEELLASGKYPVLRVGNFFTNNDWYYSDLELSEDKYCDKGDLLYAWSASFGPRIWTGDKVIYHYHIWKVIANSSVITKEFLYHLLNWDVEKIKSDHGTGTTMMHVGKGSMDARVVPIPPIPEQQLIVSILDQAFAAIDKAKANAERNLHNAKELFDSYLQSVFDDINETWIADKLGNTCVIKPQKSEAKEKLKQTDLVTFLPMEDLGVLNKNINGAKERQFRDVVGSYTYFADNDVLLAKITPCFENGKLGIARNLTNGIGFGSSEYIVFRPKKCLEPEYLYYFLSRKCFREEGRKTMTGAVGHKRVSKDWIENIIIPYPELISDQRSIVKNCDALSAKIQKLESIYQQKLIDLEELKKSILQKAFSRELTST